MRAPLAVAALLTALAACAVPAGSGTDGRGYEPLSAYITGPEFGGGLGFQLNRPAYVAIVEVMPNRGTSLVYPYPGSGRSSGYAFSGRAHLGTRFAGRDIYQPTHGHTVLQGPTFYLLIASEQPLNLDRLGGFGMGLRSALGVHWAASSPYHTMERVAETLLPSAVDDGSWTSDLYVHWPQALSRDPAARSVLLSCNGYQTYVRLEYLALAYQAFCGRPSESPAERVDSIGAAESEVVPRRRPAPEATSEMRDRVRTSAQLEERREARVRRAPGSRMPEAGDARRPVAGAERTGPARRADARPGHVRDPESVRAPRAQPQERGSHSGGDGGSLPARAPSSGGDSAPRAAPDRPSAGTPAPAPTPERCADC